MNFHIGPQLDLTLIVWTIQRRKVHPSYPTSSPSPPSGPRAQRPVRLPVNHPERRCYEEVGPAADPHERHSGLQQVLQLLQPLPSDHHPWKDLPSWGKRNFSLTELYLTRNVFLTWALDVTVGPEHFQAPVVCLQVSHLEDIVEQTGYTLERDSEYSQKILEEEEEVSVSVTQQGGRTLQHQVTGDLRGSNMLPWWCLIFV